MTAAFEFGPARRPRRASLTPVIDVVFLLLVFFMLAARFGAEAALPLGSGVGGGGGWDGPPRLVDLSPEGPRLNGRPVAPAGLAAALGPLMPAPDSPVVLRTGRAADVQALAEVLDQLTATGLTRLVIVD